MKTITFDELTVPAPPAGSADWNDDGVWIIPGLANAHDINAYCQVWEDHHGAAWPPGSPGGWPDCTPYMRHTEILDLVDPIAPYLEDLMGEPAGMHLNLTGWVTTERDWHQDSYLNPAHVGDFYAAVWIALEDIDPDSGPFQYVPGSHRWPQVTRERIWWALDDYRGHDWPTRSEVVLSPLFEQEIATRNADVVTYLPKRGDVLIWHGRLLHRGSKARVPGMRRRAFIAHFSGINHRWDMPPAQRYDEGFYFPIEHSSPVR